MTRMLVVALATTYLFTSGCSQEQKPTPPRQAESKSSAASPVPATSSTPTAVVPAKPAEPAKAAATKPAVKLPAVPDTVTLAASQGEVTLSHLTHAKRFPCASCHGEATPGKLALGKEAAHTLCRDCHQSRGTGPTDCSGCHQK